jgi:hypothetical protein
MKITFAKVVQPLRLANYAPEMGEQVVQVWVNPPRDRRIEFLEMAEEIGKLTPLRLPPNGRTERGNSGGEIEKILALGERQAAWVAEMLSQHPDASTHWTVEEIKGLQEASGDTDPAFWRWLTGSIIEMMIAHRTLQKKS